MQRTAISITALKEELMDVYAYFYKNQSADQGKLDTLQGILGLTGEETSSIKQLVDSGNFTFEQKNEDDMAIF